MRTFRLIHLHNEDQIEVLRMCGMISESGKNFANLVISLDKSG